MAVTVQRGVRARLGPEATVLLQACSDTDPARLAGALATAGADIAALDGPRYVSDPMPTPDGPILLVDLGSATARQIRAIPAMLVRRIEEAGIGDAVVRIPPTVGERHERVAGWAPAVRAWLRGPLVRPFGPADPAPPLWLFDAVTPWLRAAPAAGTDPVAGPDPTGTEVVALIASAEVPLSWDSARPAAQAALRAGAEATLLASDFTSTAVAVSVCGAPAAVAPHAALGAAGAGWSAVEVTGRMRQARDLVRSRAGESPGLSWAGVSVESDARDLTSWQWYDRDPGGTRRDVALTSDVLVPDGMWYQVLSAGHLERLGGRPDGGSALPGGRVELTVGEAEQWLPGHPDRAEVQARARSLLASCLAGREEIHAMNAQRLRDARDRDDGTFFDANP